MAHYAFLDENNTVVEVIVGNDEGSGTDWETYYSRFRGLKCRRTSYNTKSGTHTSGGTPYRGNYAGIGYQYDESLDAFIPPKPAEDCTLNSVTI